MLLRWRTPYRGRSLPSPIRPLPNDCLHPDSAKYCNCSPKVIRRKIVAGRLHISVRTAENHKAQIMRLLGATSTADLVKCAIRHGLIAPS